MKNISLYLSLVSFSFLFLATTCDDDTVPSCENRLESLAKLGERLKNSLVPPNVVMSLNVVPLALAANLVEDHGVILYIQLPSILYYFRNW